MRKTLLAGAVSLASVAPLVAVADIHDARSLARGGTGLTLGGFNQALYNPALINRFNEKDDFSFAINVGAFASDKDGFIDELDNFDDLIERLENNAPANPDNPGLVADADASLQALSDKLVQVDAGGALLIAIPNKVLPMALVGKAKASVGAKFDYDPGDLVILGGIAANTSSEEYLRSEGTASAVAVTEVGLMFGKGFSLGDLAIEGGATLKAQQIELLSYTDFVADFDIADAIDSKNAQKKHSAINLDLGAVTRLGEKGRFVLAGTIENLIPATYKGPTTEEYKSEPVVTVGAGYGGSYFKAEANLDLTARSGYDLLHETQFARLGVELSAGRHLHLRAGYRTDLKSNVSDLITAGIGISPFDVFNIDISGGIGEGETYAAAVQIGFKF